MKILILTKELPFPANTARKIRTYNYIRDLIKGNQVTVLSRYDRSYDNTPAVDHFTELGCTPVFCNETVRIDSPLIKFKNLVFSLFSAYPYSVSSCISPRMVERFLRTYSLGKYDVIICDGIHQTIHVPKEVYSYKILLEHAISLPQAKDVLRKNSNPFQKLFSLLEWKKFRNLEDAMWKIYDEIHLYDAQSKEFIEQRVGHKKVKVIQCE